MVNKKTSKNKKANQSGRREARTQKSGSSGDAASDPQAASGKKKRECVVVGIGASAGGLDCYKKFLMSVPEDSGLAFVLVQHLDPSHESLMVELLSKYTAMPVVQVENAMPVEPNHVYMIPPNRFIKIADGGLFLNEPVIKRGVKLPIDYFFCSLAEAMQERAICVVFSGTGSDGADGVREVKAAGGMTLVQKPDTAEYDGMPRAAIATGCVDFVVAIDDVAGIVIPYAKHPYVQSKPKSSLVDSAPDHFRAILSLLRAHTDQDFSRYKKGTLTRRIERRMGIRQISRPGDYLKLMREDHDERRALFKDLLIGVTRFFRDEAAWQTLGTTIAKAIASKVDEEPFRVWVPGCSTGEEAFSIAMLLDEQQQRQQRRLDIQVFATDIDSDAIDIARGGLYPMNIAKDVSERRLETYFHREGEKYRVRKKLRESCIFAVQNVLADPPFSNLDLVSCRNLMIYLEADVQGRLFDMLHFALKPDGLLFLGSSESLAKRKQHFQAISQSHRVYRKVGVSQPGDGGILMKSKESHSHDAGLRETDVRDRSRVGIAELSKRTLLDQFAPASVVVNHEGLIQYMHGPIRDYLDFPSGEPDLRLGTMAQEGLKAKSRSALEQARTTDEVVSVLARRVKRNGGHVSVRIRAQPLPRSKGSEPLLLVSFFDEVADPLPLVSAERLDAGSLEVESSNERDRQLVLELQSTREDLQSTIEELESANEELKASNEEVMSMNEELQSTNEELETSREELQSLNEELSTVNNQLHDKVGELESTTNDLQNLLASTDMATLFLNSDLQIRRFTPAMTRLVHILDSDVGRPVSDLAPRVEDPELVRDARMVLDRLVPIEKEVQSDGKTWYIRRIMPFRTAENKIEGVVITFADITSVKRVSHQLMARENQQAVVARLGRLALAADSLQELFDCATRDVAKTLGVRFCKLLRLTPERKKLRLVAGVGWKEGIVGQATVSASTQSQAGFTLQSSAPIIVRSPQSEKRFALPPLLVEHGVVSGMSVIVGPGEEPWGVLGVHADQLFEFTHDDTNFIQAVANVLWEAIDREISDRRFRALVHSSAQIVWSTNAAGEVVEDSPSWRAFTGQTWEQWRGEGWLDALHPDDRDRTRNGWREAVSKKQSYATEYRLRSADGSWRWTEVACVPLMEFDGTVRGWVGMNSDITSLKEAEEYQGRLAAIIESSHDAIIGKTLDGTITSWNQAAEKLYGYQADEMIGQSIALLIPEDRPSELEEILEKLRSGEGIHHYETMRRCKDGSLRDVSLTISPIRDSFGDVFGASAIARDVTAQKLMERKLDEARQAAESANQAKSNFLANMSHEIRTPMTAILGYADVLAAQLDDPDAQACLRTIKSNGTYLCDIINDILDLSKIESGKLDVHREEVSLVRILADIRSLMAVRATEKNLTLSVDFEGLFPDRILTDSKLIRQVLVNLVGNAIKFTEEGGVKVTCRCFKEKRIIEIAVIDSGIGISRVDLAKLFEPFEQLDNSYTRVAGGSGLGLAISKKLVGMLGGEMSIDSAPGEGSTFRFTIAIEELDGTRWTEPHPDDLRVEEGDTLDDLPKLSGRILTADDRRDIRFLVNAFVGSAGAEVESQEDGRALVNAFSKSVEENLQVDAVVVDMQMPVLDGLAATREIRALGYEGPIVALTANAMEADRKKCLEAGCDDVVTKPIDRASLISTLAKWMKLRSTNDSDHGVNSEASVLCIDRSHEANSRHKELIEKLGHEVVVAASGETAFQAVARVSPQIAIVDSELLDVSAEELVSQLKTKPELTRCRYICSSTRDEHEIDWKQMGFDLFLQKPLSAEQVKQAIHQLLQ